MGKEKIEKGETLKISNTYHTLGRMPSLGYLDLQAKPMANEGPGDPYYLVGGKLGVRGKR
jgi:hypothetical protein